MKSELKKKEKLKHNKMAKYLNCGKINSQKKRKARKERRKHNQEKSAIIFLKKVGQEENYQILPHMEKSPKLPKENIKIIPRNIKFIDNSQ